VQSLGVVQRLFPDVVSGAKTSTIRWREARICSGYMTYICDGAPDRTVMVWVTHCTDMPLCDAAAFVGRQDDWPDAVMLDGMREHYPAITLDDVVQVVEHLTPGETRERPDFPG
jgi:hypothetical protein